MDRESRASNEWWINKVGGGAFLAEAALEYNQVIDVLPVGDETALSLAVVLLFGKKALKLVVGGDD